MPKMVICELNQVFWSNVHLHMGVKVAVSLHHISIKCARKVKNSSHIYGIQGIWSVIIYIAKKFGNGNFFIQYNTLVCRIDMHAHLLILRKNSPLHGLILVCTFIVFKKKNSPAHLFSCMRIGICWHVF